MNHIRKKVLFLRKMKSDFVFTSNYLELLANNTLEQGHELYVYDLRQRKLMDFQSMKTKKYFSFLNFFDNSIFRIPINILTFIYFSLKNKKKYDLVHVLFIRSEYFLLKFFVKNLGVKLALSIFGSDLEVGSKWKVYFKKLFYFADQIHCQNPQIYEKFLNRYIPIEKRELIIQKKNIIEYPIESLKILSNTNNSINENEIRSKYNLNINDIIVFCGTTARLNLEQSYKLASVLSKSDIINLKNLKIIFPLTYGGNKNEINNFKKFILKDLNFKNKIILIEKYLSIKDILAFRKITDIFINVRLHDQLVTSMIEAFYCKSDVITGNWLPYDIFKKNNFFYHSLDEIEEISSLLPTVIEARMNKQNVNELNNNRNIIMKLWNPEKMTIEWNQFYNKLLKF